MWQRRKKERRKEKRKKKVNKTETFKFGSLYLIKVSETYKVNYVIGEQRYVFCKLFFTPLLCCTGSCSSTSCTDGHFEPLKVQLAIFEIKNLARIFLIWLSDSWLIFDSWSIIFSSFPTFTFVCHKIYIISKSKNIINIHNNMKYHNKSRLQMCMLDLWEECHSRHEWINKNFTSLSTVCV